MKKILLSAAFVAFCIMGANAQRMTDKLNRGLVAVKTDKGCSAVGESQPRSTTMLNTTSIVTAQN